MNKPLKKNQIGAATLVVAVVLLISITLVTLFTAKIVLEDTKIEANFYRSAQAFSIANYGLDHGINNFDQSGFDINNDGVLDTGEGDFSPDVSSIGGVTLSVLFDPGAERCGGEATSLQNGLILSAATVDNDSAARVMGQCVGPISILNGDGPEIPLIARTRIDTTGNANIINRYTNTNIWSADEVIITGASMGTYIRDPASGPLTESQLLNVDEDINTQLVSNRNLGNGADIIAGDPSLKLDAGFFGNFFNADQRSTLKDLAAANQQSFGEGEIGEAVGKSGLIYLEGDQSLTGGTIGSIDSPAIIIVDGDLKTTGNPIIYGIVYVVNKFDVGGTPSIVGASIVENEGGADSATGFEGNGTLNLVYWQNFLNDDGQPLPGLTSVIEGSWRDW